MMARRENCEEQTRAEQHGGDRPSGWQQVEAEVAAHAAAADEVRQ